MTKKVRTAQVDNKLFIMNGNDPMRYVDLTTNKVHQYKKPRVRFITKVLSRIRNKEV